MHFLLFLGSVLTNFMPPLPFYTPWKQQKTSGFPKFSWGLKKEQRNEIGELVGNLMSESVLKKDQIWINKFN